MNPTLKTQLRDLYHLSPVLWAVTQGCLNLAEINEKLGKDSSRGLKSALRSGLLTEHGQGYVLHLVNHHHLNLARQLNPLNEVDSAHPALRLLDLGPANTRDIAFDLQRSYNSTYKTLRRLEAAHYVTRQGKLWAKV